jgi:hypothetical protein
VASIGGIRRLVVCAGAFVFRPRPRQTSPLADSPGLARPSAVGAQTRAITPATQVNAARLYIMQDRESAHPSAGHGFGDQRGRASRYRTSWVARAAGGSTASSDPLGCKQPALKADVGSCSATSPIAVLQSPRSTSLGRVEAAAPGSCSGTIRAVSGPRLPDVRRASAPVSEARLVRDANRLPLR